MQVFKREYIALYGTVVDVADDGDIVINYFHDKVGYNGKYWVLKEGNLDCREVDELRLVNGIPDEHGRFTFKNLEN